MQPITLKDIVPLSTYRQGRAEYVHKMIAYKKKRRVALGDHLSLLFENRQTVLFQVLELLHTEDLEERKEIQEYLDIYNPMIPAAHELSGTLFIEADEQELLERLLVDLRGIEHHLFLLVGDSKIQAVFEEEHTGEVTSSVHYVKFPLPSEAEAYLRNTPAEEARVHLLVNHPKATAEAALSAETIAALQEDLQ